MSEYVEHPFFTSIEKKTLQLLRWRRARKIRRKEKSKSRGFVKDWAHALVSAFIMVILIWHFLFQLYQIPSGSMEKTLLIGDRVLVGKTLYGPTILPGWNSGPQLPSIRDPQRDDVITFRSPLYESPGFFTNILQKTLFIISFSAINLQVDDEGNPLSEFYVKRVAATGNDRVRFENGRVEIRPAGFSEFIDEGEFRKISGIEDPRQHLFTQSAVERSSRGFAERYAFDIFGIGSQVGSVFPIGSTLSMDQYSVYATMAEFFYRLNPQRSVTPSSFYSDSEDTSLEWLGEVQDWHRYSSGIYVPNGYVLPLGDNRHNSLDGRFFGPRREREIIGITRYVLAPSPRFVQ